MTDSMKVALATKLIDNVMEAGAPDGEDSWSTLLICVETVLKYGEESNNA